MTRWLAVSLLASLLFAQSALAFRWTPLEFPEGDQRYTLEVRTPAEAGEAQVGTIDIVIDEEGGQYSVTTTYAFTQGGVAGSSLGEAALGGSMMGMFAFGPMMLFGPSFMLLPMMLGEEDIAVRAEPMRVMGMGRLTMSESVEVAGRECVVIRFEPDDGDAFELAVAENVPFPCYTRYDTGDGVMEIRLVRIE